MRKALLMIAIMAVLCAAMLTAGCCCCTGCDVSSLVPSLMPTATPTPTPTLTPTPTPGPTATPTPASTPTPGPKADPDDPVLGVWYYQSVTDNSVIGVMTFNNDLTYRWDISGKTYTGTWVKIEDKRYRVSYSDSDGQKSKVVIYSPNSNTLTFEDQPFGMYRKSV